MSDQEAVEHWAQVDRLLDRVLALPATDRAAFVAQQTSDDPRLRDEVLALLSQLDTRGDLFDRPALSALSSGAPALDLQPGHRVGAYRVLALLGRGGMGEVYRAERADGQFEHQIALKLLRQDAIEHLSLFISERRILAKLEHPGIARLYDAGVGDDGRPYMVMELVEGVPITDWCRQRKANLDERLALFGQVCDAVAYAHQNLVIHRDLKPGNILVTDDGRAKLLDFGVAKLLSGAVEEATRNTPMTLSYAAPEQLTRTTVSTATDIYALGVLLFELLTDRLPWTTGQIPIAVAIEKVLHETAPAPGAIAARMASPPVSARQLSGDLDAIVGKSLRKGPADRYATVAGLQADVRRHLHGEPVTARGGAGWYVFGRFMSRYRWAVAGVAALIVTLATGLAGTTWQARRAESEAARATATKDFMLSLFRASDPRIASDKPRAEITAKQLLDLGAARIEKDFAGQPELQIELLGLTSDIYEQLADEDRYAAMQKRRIQLARAHYGPAHPIVLDGLISEAEAAIYRQDYVKAGSLLDGVDAQLDGSAQNRSVLRARWWLVKWELLHSAAGSEAAMDDAVDRSIALYRQLAPNSNDYAYVLGLKAINYGRVENYAQERRYFEQSLAVLEAAPDRSDSDLGILLNNYARNLEKLGDYAAAERIHVRSEELARKTSGERYPRYWLARAYHARLLHRHGERERANALFEQMLASIPPDWTSTNEDAWARGEYAVCLAAEGRAREAIPILEATLRSYSERSHGTGLAVWRLDLGDAYDRAGRTDEARAMLKAAIDEVRSAAQPDPKKLLTFGERWGRFLLDHASPGDPDFAQASAALKAVVAQAAGRPSVELALAHAGLARVAIATGDTRVASNESELALTTLNRVQALYDVRVQPQLWLVRSAALRQRGDKAVALQWAGKALAASRRYDGPSSPAIAEAEGAVRAATAVQSHKAIARK